MNKNGLIGQERCRDYQSQVARAFAKVPDTFYFFAIKDGPLATITPHEPVYDVNVMVRRNSREEVIRILEWAMVVRSGQIAETHSRVVGLFPGANTVFSQETTYNPRFKDAVRLQFQETFPVVKPENCTDCPFIGRCGGYRKPEAVHRKTSPRKPSNKHVLFL